MSSLRITCTALSLVLGLLAAGCAQQSNAETIDKRLPAAASELSGSIVPYRPEVHGKLPAALLADPNIAKQQKFMKVFTNTSKKNITALTFKWTYTRPGDSKERGAIISRDSYFLRYTVIPPGAKLLVAPSTLMNLETVKTGKATVSAVSPTIFEEMSRAASLQFSTDLIMFEDGTTIGPDTVGTVDRLRVRQAEARNFRGRLVAGESLESIVAKKMASMPLLNDPGMQVIRALQGAGKNADSKTLARMLETLHALPVTNGGRR